MKRYVVIHEYETMGYPQLRVFGPYRRHKRAQAKAEELRRVRGTARVWLVEKP